LEAPLFAAPHRVKHAKTRIGRAGVFGPAVIYFQGPRLSPPPPRRNSGRPGRHPGKPGNPFRAAFRTTVIP